MPILNPNGYVAQAEYDLLILAVGIMAAIVVPVILATLWIALHYRASNTQSAYEPEFDHSPALNFVTIFIPLLTIALLGAITWVYTHRLDPYRPLGGSVRPYEIQALSLDHKWLFIYPDDKIAVVGELVAPIGRPVTIRITSDPMMTAIFIPSLISQIYAMPGMETRANFIADRTGTMRGANAMYSGPGFSKGGFNTHLVDEVHFDQWLAEVKAARPPSAGSTAKSEALLDLTRYAELAKRTEGYPITYFRDVTEGLFQSVVRKYAQSYALNPLPTTELYDNRAASVTHQRH